MSDDLQFGELETKEPDRGLRPDRNRHYAVVPYGNPREGELPIYIDLDVMHDIEVHAVSDKTVELGGVLLGGQFHDEAGQPFVLITDSLRAEHYESTKGSFKFTHETWSAISRQRDEFPPDCQMVGWYHTHPDWGVFLSSMDMFICDNFFNKLLDVAYVVDPCRGDRGMFQWITGPKQTTRRTGGFYVIASRFRQAELESFVTALEEGDAMPSLNEPRGSSQTVVHLHGQQPNWMGPAVLGMLFLQFALVALVAFKLIGSEAKDTEKLLAKLVEQRTAEVKAETQKKVLDRVLSELKQTEPGTVGIVEDQTNEIRGLYSKIRDHEDLSNSRAVELANLSAKLKDANTKIEDNEKRFTKKIEEADKNREYYTKKSLDLEKELKLRDAAATADGETASVSPRMVWIIGGSIAVLVAAAVAAGIIHYQRAEEVRADQETPEDFEPSVTPPAAANADQSAAQAPAVDAPQPVSPSSSTPR